jgi:ABC-type multidrug transport system fused ATPase/permease subunit
MPVLGAAAKGRRGAAAATERASGSFVRSQLKYLVVKMPKLMGALVVASVLAGLSEAVILAVLAQGALLLVNHKSGVSLGGVHLNLTSLFILGIACAFLRLGSLVVTCFVPARISDNTQARLRNELFAAFTRASWELQSRDREGHLQELLTNQISAATAAFTTAAGMIVSLLMFGVLLVSALVLNVLAALLVLVLAIALSGLLRPLGRLGNQYAGAVSLGLINYAGGVSEAVRLAEEAHVFGVEASQRRRNDEKISAFRGSNVRANFFGGLAPGVYQSLIYLLLILALVGLDALGTGHIAALGAVVLLLVRSGAYGQQVQTCIQTLRQTQPYVERVQEAADRYDASVPLTGDTPLDTVRSLRFEHVCFSYDRGQPVLSDINFEIKAGEAVGIIGPSGVGKSTVVQILLGLRQPSSGKYLVNGLPGHAFNREDWRKHFAYVPQEPRLLHASVADNVRFFRRIDDDSVERATRLAGIHDDVMAWPNGYDTIVGPRADAISGGQQQRICLARALAASPEVLVLDEPTSALDPGAEQLIQESLRGLKDKLTLFIVAHRMSTLDICERVMVIVGGRLDAFDHIPELQVGNTYYRSAVAAGHPSPVSARDHTGLREPT